jgi:hypothetical protein
LSWTTPHFDTNWSYCNKKCTADRVHERRSAVLHPAVLIVFIGPQGDGDRSAGDRSALASGRLSSLLALEIAGRGRPPISAELGGLIRRMSVENALWGAPRIQGELLKLGFAVAQSTVARYMAKRDDPSDQSWSTFLGDAPGSPWQNGYAERLIGTI